MSGCYQCISCSVPLSSLSSSLSDVNELLGDIVKVTPSSKCVGDLALYLVTRKLKASELLASAASVDWPDSVVGYVTLFYSVF